MRLASLIIGVVLAAAPAAAQSPSSTPPSSDQSSAPASTTPSERSDADRKDGNLPVSLDHIRAGLKQQATDSLLKRIDLPADFRIQVMEQQRLDDLLSKLDFKSSTAPGPIPGAGIYGYEQQRRLFNPVDNPLAQPYAAFNGGELITIAIENLIAKFLGGPMSHGVTEAQRSSAERAARDEVSRAIADYCAGRTDRDAIEICRNPSALH